MPRFVLICPEPIRRLQQGVGIRFLEMARELTRLGAVSLWAPNADLPAEDRFELRPFPGSDFASALAGVEAAVIHGHISERYFNCLHAHGLAGPPLVVDLCDPFLIENLQYTPQLGESIYARDREVLGRQLARGDFFLASSEAQRLFYLGLLVAQGRVSPAAYHADRTLRNLIDVAPFGVRLPEDGVQGGGLKGAHPGIAAGDVVLFFGGVYDWYDPGALLDVLPALLDRHPKLRLVFSRNPNLETTPQAALGRVLERARDTGWLDRQVFCVSWFPYAERFRHLGDADLAVCLHAPSLETELSLRTRILDFLNAGLPVVSTEGGEGGRLLEESGGGWLVPAGDRGALRDALDSLLSDPARRAEMGQRGREWVRGQRPWDRTLAPLLRFCAAPSERREGTGSRSGWRSALRRLIG